MESSEQGEGSGQEALISKVQDSRKVKNVSMIYSNFDFLNRPWWKPSYDERDANYFVLSAKRHQHAILLATNESDALLWKGYIDLHREHYLLECISAESNVDLTMDFIRQALKKPGILGLLLSWLCGKIFASFFIPERSLRLNRKVKNMHDAIIDIFPSIFFPDLPIDQFTPSFAQQLHRQIGNELISNAGQYRTRHVMAAQENYVYMAPDLIEDKMNELFCQCREKFGRTDLQLEEAIKYGACFLVYFLTIHPFINGNGRVVRLLLSYLLSKFTVVPLSLFTGSKTRDVYLQCLREARYQNPFNPGALAAFILECVYKTSYNMCVVMDINIQN
ncbi:Fic-domain-containing protein [Gigaspora margarita]|uniref:Fic-domain-containing protein n=1 Tax=Gigaspora margarita TaxID=4874 RepID=A0A8H3X9E4_GIGMA|nr:Fic-domain-containing protein [Gigaspora margarita]